MAAENDPDLGAPAWRMPKLVGERGRNDKHPSYLNHQIVCRDPYLPANIFAER